MSIVADRDDLLGDYGILSTGRDYDEWYLNGCEGDEPEVNYLQTGREWEIPADMEYFREGKRVTNQKCGLKLQGRTTRQRRIKNFQIRSRASYSGSDVFEYNFFDNEPFKSDAVTLDNSFNESFFLSLIEEEDIIKQKTSDRVALFINGEFWNNIYIHQKLDRRYFVEHLGVSEDNFFVLSEGYTEIGDPGGKLWEEDEKSYAILHEYAKNNDLTIEDNYNTISKMMDIENYVNYLAINTWIGCMDWGEYENDMVIGLRECDNSIYGDGRIRWIIHDSDYIFNRGFVPRDSEYIRNSVLYNALMKNQRVRKLFVEKLNELGNTTFSEQNILCELSKEKWDEPEKNKIIDFFSDRKEDIQKMVYENDF